MNLHVVEDGEMIRWLGREKFVQLSIHGTLGWQIGVSAHSYYQIGFFSYCLFKFEGFFLLFFFWFWGSLHFESLVSAITVVHTTFLLNIWPQSLVDASIVDLCVFK